MIDPNRLLRVHVVNVRLIDGTFYVIYSDGSTLAWNVYVATPTWDVV